MQHAVKSFILLSLAGWADVFFYFPGLAVVGLQVRELSVDSMLSLSHSLLKSLFVLFGAVPKPGCPVRMLSVLQVWKVLSTRELVPGWVGGMLAKVWHCALVVGTIHGPRR